MRILVLSHMYPRATNSTSGIFVHEQILALRRLGHDVRIASGSPVYLPMRNLAAAIGEVRAHLSSPPSWTQLDGVPVLYFNYPAGRWFPAGAVSLSYAAALRRLCRRGVVSFPFDLIHAHTGLLDGHAARDLALRHGRPYVVTEHTGPYTAISDTWLKRYLNRRVYRDAARFFAVSRTLKRQICDALGVGQDRIDLLANGVDPLVFRPGSQATEHKAGSKIRALWIGHHLPVKRVDRLIRGIERARAKLASLELTLLGDGPDRQRNAELARDLGIETSVRFVESGSRIKVRDAIRSHDFVVVSSEVETFSLAALEALACGKPVLSTACGGPQEIISDERYGLITENSTSGMAKGLVEISQRLPNYSASDISAYAHNTYDHEAIAGRLAAVFQELTAPAGSSSLSSTTSAGGSRS